MSSSKFTLLFLLLFTTACSLSPVKTFIADNPGVNRDPANFQSCFQMMNAVINHRQVDFQDESLLTKAKDLNELEQAYGEESLIDLQRRLDNESIKAATKHAHSLLTKPVNFDKSMKKATYVTPQEAQEILNSITNSKVNQNHYCYDPNNTTGFCFGRAVIGHMEALARGVHPDAIKKIWIAGDMKEWGHHVAPMVKSENGWLVLDTNIGKPLSPEAWYKYYTPMKAPKAKDIMLFVTQGGRFGPYDNEAYSAVNLFNTNGDTFDRANDFYKGYFHDYFEALEQDKTFRKIPVR